MLAMEDHQVVEGVFTLVMKFEITSANYELTLYAAIKVDCVFSFLLYDRRMMDDPCFYDFVV